MTLIKSVSGIRGTMGGNIGDNLTPIDVVKLTAAYALLLKEKYKTPRPTVAIGRDGRISGPLVLELVGNTLQQSGVDVIDIGLTTTPTIEYFVQENTSIHGGIITSASHNPREWNALKLLNADGEFLNQTDGQFIIEKSELPLTFANVDNLGTKTTSTQSFPLHLKGILNLDYVLTEEIQKRKFKVVVDGINSSGGVMVPELLKSLNVEVELIHGLPTGEFAHNPEPLKQNLTDLIEKVKETKADMGIAVDPDVDRLVLVSENGEMFGEEYTLVAAADHYLDYHQTPLVSNMSSSLALRDLAKEKGVDYHAAKVGELHVVELMKKVGCTIGGEGNGGVILGDLHYGRDALVGIALILSKLAKENIKLSELRSRYTHYEMVKDKIAIEGLNKEALFEKFKLVHEQAELDDRDGVKAQYDDCWVHLRASNTEPIMRIYTEATSIEKANSLVTETKTILN